MHIHVFEEVARFINLSWGCSLLTISDMIVSGGRCTTAKKEALWVYL